MGTIHDVYSKWDKEDWTHIQEDPRSLKSCLRRFGFVRLLQDLDDNLEAVRRHRISEDAHKKMIKDFDKKLLKLSLSHHPDRLGDATGLTEAKNNQATINAIRSLITRLSEDFLRDIDIDYRYEYYAYIDISSIGSEGDVDKLNLNLQYQLIMLSEIKHEKIIANIKKFLMSCEGSLDSYFEDDRRNFVLNFNLALSRLKECIMGYKALTKEFSNVEKECENNQNLQNTLWTVKEMSADFERQLKILEKIKDVAKQSLKGNFHIYAENEIMDDYFVLPFAKYLNVLSMCHVMLGNTERSWLSSKNYNKNLDFSQLDGSDTRKNYLKAYCLASYIDNPNSSNENNIHKILNNNLHGDTLMSFCKYNFNSTLHEIREDLKQDFNVEKHYIVRSVKKRTEEYNREVQEYFDGVLRRKNSNMLALIDGQEKNRSSGEEKAILLCQRIKYEKDIAKRDTRKVSFDEDFKEGIKWEEELFEKIRDNFKEKGEILKTKILQIEITNENLREALDVNKKEEKALLEKLGKHDSQNDKKLISEILEREEENRKLSDEIQMKWEEERFLILTLCGKYEKISAMCQEKINEIEKRVLENKSSEDSIKGTGYQEVKNDFEEDMNCGKSLRGKGNQNSMLDKKNTVTENFRESLEHQICAQEYENKNKSDILKLRSQATLPMLETEENDQKMIKNGTENQKLTKGGLLFEHNYQHAIRETSKENPHLKKVENEVENTKSVQESVKEYESFETTGDEIDKQMFLHEHRREDDGEHSRLKEVARHELTKRKSKYLTSFEIQDREVKLYANYIKNRSILKKYIEEKTSEIDMENKNSFESFEAEQEKHREILEALRSVKKKYTYELKKCK